MKITIETIPHGDQRIPGQVGDWQWITPAELRIRVSTMTEMTHCMAVALHEMVEAMLCWKDGVSEAAVDDFDKLFVVNRPK